jgi:cytochrome c-type biogenesis protein CcmH
VIFVAILLFAAIAVAPMALSLRWAARLRSRRESALAVHRAQLAELERDVAEGSIRPTEHANAVLEVQRRLLADAATPDEPDMTGESRAGARLGRARVITAMVLIPLAAFGLYLVNGHPELPAEPLATRIARARHEAARSEQLIGELRAKVATLDPKSDVARQGFMLLGNAEESLGHFGRAAAAWRSALAVRFDPELAAATAELQTRADGKVSPQSAALFRAALAAGPANAPWRALALQRLKTAGG